MRKADQLLYDVPIKGPVVTKILIIEDDALLSRMYETVFKAKSYEVIVAADGQAGLEQARSGHPAAILLDIMMPKLNGLDLLQQLKADPAVKDIPVVVLSNLTGNTDISTALRLGAVRYIVKSEQKPKQVEQIISELLAGK